jgi:hypothetical protein
LTTRQKTSIFPITMEHVKLGQKVPEPSPALVGAASSRESMVYPNVRFELDEDALKQFAKFPDEGRVTLCYRAVSKEVHSDANGEKRGCVCWELTEIYDVEKEPEKDSSESLDKLAGEVSASESDEPDEDDEDEI